MIDDQKDMIGRTKEFLERLNERDCIDHNWTWTYKRRDSTPDLSGRMLAEALLIAVEALEEAREYAPTQSDDACNIMDRAHSRIRSLPSA